MSATLSRPPTIDCLDKARIQERIDNRRKMYLPRVGDFVKVAETTYRICVQLGHRYQLTSYPHAPRSYNGFYMARDGRASYSGACGRMVSLNNLIPTTEEMPGGFWMFHHDQAKAHNAVDFEMPCRVYEYKDANL
jgi:hypothetical protein